MKNNKMNELNKMQLNKVYGGADMDINYSDLAEAAKRRMEEAELRKQIERLGILTPADDQITLGGLMGPALNPQNDPTFALQ